MLLLYNPIRRQGFAFEASQSAHWHHIHISALDYLACGIRIAGLATQEWIDQMIEKHGGVDSPFVQANVFGEWPSVQAGGIFSLERIQAAQQLHGTASTEFEVIIGVDPAGDSESERIDATAIAVIKGNRMLDLFADKGLSSDQIVDIVEELGQQYSPEQRYRVQYDSEGLIGRQLGEALRARALKSNRFESYGIRSWDKPRDPQLYGRIRDELAGHLDRWVKDGGSVVPNRELEEELLAMRWLDPDRQGRARLVDNETCGRCCAGHPTLSMRLLPRHTTPAKARCESRYNASSIGVAFSCPPLRAHLIVSGPANSCHAGSGTGGDAFTQSTRCLRSQAQGSGRARRHQAGVLSLE